jgi:hypothetical protein
MSQTTLHEAAVGYLLAHQGEHLSHDRALLVERCSDYLRTVDANVTRVTAEVTTLQALGELGARGNNVHIDLTKTTSYAVFVVDPVNKVSTFFTAADLLNIARYQNELRAADAATKH